MPFIKSFSIDTDRINPFPFNIPAVKFARQVLLDTPVMSAARESTATRHPILHRG
jgi:hypothetical protein